MMILIMILGGIFIIELWIFILALIISLIIYAYLETTNYIKEYKENKKIKIKTKKIDELKKQLFIKDLKTKELKELKELKNKGVLK